MDNTVNLDQDGFLNYSYYKNATLDIISRQATQDNIDLSRITSNQLRACFRSCYYALFKPDNTSFNNYSCNIPYSEKNINILFNIYIEVCERFSCIPSLYGFSRYSGIDEDTTQKYVTGARFEMVKSRKDYIQNSMSNSQVGVITLANNDSDSGLMYNRQNLIDHETVKQNLTLNDIRQLAQKDVKS